VTRLRGLRGVWLILALCAGLLVSGPACGTDLSEYGNPWVWVSLGQVAVQAEVVSTPERLYLGLSNRAELPEGRGMLFKMPALAVQTFCMRDMRLPLDFIWISEDKVAGLTRSVPPTFPGDLTSPGPVNYVLEVPGGFAEKFGIKVGDRVTWRPPD
jgi:uncharacterized membrane protein (UPF0127 family)